MHRNRLVGRVRLYIKSGNLINTVCVVFTICHYFFAKRSVETPFFAWLVFLLAVYRRLYPLLSPPFDFCSQQCNIIYHHARPDSGHHRPRGPEPGEGGCKVVPSVIFFPHRSIHPSARSDPLPNHLPTMIPPQIFDIIVSIIVATAPERGVPPEGDLVQPLTGPDVPPPPFDEIRARSVRLDRPPFEHRPDASQDPGRSYRARGRGRGEEETRAKMKNKCMVRNDRFGGGWVGG